MTEIRRYGLVIRDGLWVSKAQARSSVSLLAAWWSECRTLSCLSSSMAACREPCFPAWWQWIKFSNYKSAPVKCFPLEELSWPWCLSTATAPWERQKWWSKDEHADWHKQRCFLESVLINRYRNQPIVAATAITTTKCNYGATHL